MIVCSGLAAITSKETTIIDEAGVCGHQTLAVCDEAHAKVQQPQSRRRSAGFQARGSLLRFVIRSNRSRRTAQRLTVSWFSGDPEAGRNKLQPSLISTHVAPGCMMQSP